MDNESPVILIVWASSLCFVFLNQSTDINDNAPFFPAAVYTGNVTENGTAGMTVMTMTATDYDDPMEGANAKLTYSIEQNQVNENGELIFAIDEETGVISTAVCCLDRETNPEYTIKVCRRAYTLRTRSTVA